MIILRCLNEIDLIDHFIINSFKDVDKTTSLCYYNSTDSLLKPQPKKSAQWTQYFAREHEQSVIYDCEA